MPLGLAERFGWLVLMVALCTIPLQIVHATTVTYSGVTVTTTVEIGSLTNQDTIWLTGLSTAPDGDGDMALSLQWAKDESGWFPTWQLELSSAAGLVPAGPSTRTHDGISSVVLSRSGPATGHVYEVTLSYSPALGALAIKVYDLTDEKVMFADGLSVPANETPLYAASGTAVDHYLPVATTWAPGLAETGRTFLPLYHFATRDDEAMIRLLTPAAVSGLYQVHLVHGDSEVLVGSLTPDASEHQIPINLTDVPLGSSTLRLDYVEDGNVLLSEARNIVLGQADFAMSPLQPDRNAGTVKSEFTIRGGGAYEEDFLVTVHATLFELVWDDASKDFVEIPYMQGLAAEDVLVDLSSGQAQLPIEVPFPDHTANWKLVLSPEITPRISSHASGNTRLFSSHLPAQVGMDEPYTIVVFPDTQNMSQHFPVVYTRMTDWVTANAVDNNIAAILHVGDITNHDTPSQWANAYTSMSLLHGVVPYALTLGNHDMTAGGGGQVKQRGLTLINNYFKADEARRYSNLAGTMVPDRLENHYHLFSIGGDDYLVIALEFGPPNEAVEWANEIAKQYPNHRMILLTHSYTTNRGGLSSSPANYDIGSNRDTTVNTAHDMWAKLVRPNQNSFMVISGHTWPAVPVVPFRTPRAAAGHPVFELLFDWQAEPNGGNGWLGLLTFHPDNTVEVNVYSPFLGEYAQERDSYGFTSHMIIDLETGLVRQIRY